MSLLGRAVGPFARKGGPGGFLRSLGKNIAVLKQVAGFVALSGKPRDLLSGAQHSQDEQFTSEPLGRTTARYGRVSLICGLASL